MKKVIAIGIYICIFVICLAVNVNARIYSGYQSYPDSYFEWQLDTTSGILIVEGSTMPWSVQNSQWNSSQCQEFVKEVRICGDIRNICDYAFSGCVNLEKVVIFSSVKSIGEYAFQNCSSLESIVIPESVTSIGDYAFKGCTSLASIDIPDSITSIGEYVFSGCSSLESVVIPNSITSIGKCAFQNCSSLESIDIPNNVTSIGEYVFSNCSSLENIVISESVTSIGEDAFRNCSSLKSVIVDPNNMVYHSDGNCLIKTSTQTLVVGCKNSVIPNDGSVTEIGYSAFYGCSSLESIEIPNCVTRISKYAFYNCSSLTSIVIPDSVTLINLFAFDEDLVLSEIYYGGIPSQWNNISVGFTLFIGDDISIPIKSATCLYYSELYPVDNNEKYWHYVDGVPTPWQEYDENGLEYRISPDGTYYSLIGIGNYSDKDLVIKSELNGLPVKAIADFAFRGCSQIESVTIPSSITEIDINPFSNCSNLKNIYVDVDNSSYCFENNCLIDIDTKTIVSGFNNSTIPNDGSVVAIGRSAFAYCTELTNIVIPAQVNSIDASSFENSGVKEIFYCGTPKQWQLAVPERESGIKKMVRYYSESQPKDNDIYWHYVDGEIVLWDSNCAKGLEFELSDDGTYYSVVGLGACTDTRLVIPAVYNGLFVKEIANEAFWFCSELTHVDIPRTVTRIGIYAFQNCNGLRRIYIPDSVTTIDISAFVMCQGLEQVVLSDSVELIDNYAFDGCVNLSTFYFVGTQNSWYSIKKGNYWDDITGKLVGGYKVVYLEDYPPEYTPGDITGDGKVNTGDVIRLAQYVARFDVVVNEAALDVDGSGKVNTGDVIRLAQYIAGYDVKIY